MESKKKQEKKEIIKIRVKQAHDVILPEGRFKHFAVGDVIEILEKEFCENLHGKIKEEENHGTRIKER